MKRRDERGSAAIEAVVVGPAVVLLIGLVVLGGRIALAHQAVQNVAADVARAASLERSTSDARTAASTGLEASLRQHLPCVTHDLQLDLAGFRQPPGTPAAVSATVSCRISVSDLILPGMPGVLTVQSTMTSAIDTYRERR